MADTLLSTLASYILERELRPSTERQHRAVVGVFLRWAGADDIPAEKFTAELISQFLAAKQAAGNSSHYRRSLRATLKALHRHQHDGNAPGKIRVVRVADIEPDSWTPAEVDRLLLACDKVRLSRLEWHYWRTKIAVAYYTGLNGIDIERIRKSDIAPNGVLPFHRSKTGKRVTVQLPPELLAEIDVFHDGDGPIWPRGRTEEGERLAFNKIVQAAGLCGTFKKLRRTCGTQVELLHPGRGHEHLGHDRQMFERHYGDRKLLAKPPAMPPHLDAVAGVVLAVRHEDIEAAAAWL